MKMLIEIAAGGSCNLGQCKGIVELNAINKIVTDKEGFDTWLKQASAQVTNWRKKHLGWIIQMFLGDVENQISLEGRRRWREGEGIEK